VTALSAMANYFIALTSISKSTKDFLTLEKKFLEMYLSLLRRKHNFSWQTIISIYKRFPFLIFSVKGMPS